MRQDADLLERLEKIRGVVKEMDRTEEESGRALAAVDDEFQSAA